jgi:hypothetical protein
MFMRHLRLLNSAQKFADLSSSKAAALSVKIAALEAAAGSTTAALIEKLGVLSRQSRAQMLLYHCADQECVMSVDVCMCVSITRCNVSEVENFV